MTWLVYFIPVGYQRLPVIFIPIAIHDNASIDAVAYDVIPVCLGGKLVTDWTLVPGNIS